MSNFSDIGFNITTEEELHQLIEKLYLSGNRVKVNEGLYVVYTDKSGAELVIQFNNENICVGACPHFRGKSRRTVCLTEAFEDSKSDLSGAFHCWANPQQQNVPESGEYPFVFEAPDYRTIAQIDFPKSYDIQLTAFAHEMHIYDNESEFYDSQTVAEEEIQVKFASRSFIPSGLFSLDDGTKPNGTQAFGHFTGVIMEYERKRNRVTNVEFYWLLLDTLGGELDLDVVADTRFFTKDPVINGVVEGQFWLSGRLINPPSHKKKVRKSFIQKLWERYQKALGI